MLNRLKALFPKRKAKTAVEKPVSSTSSLNWPILVALILSVIIILMLLMMMSGLQLLTHQVNANHKQLISLSQKQAAQFTTLQHRISSQQTAELAAIKALPGHISKLLDTHSLDAFIAIQKKQNQQIEKAIAKLDQHLKKLDISADPSPSTSHKVPGDPVMKTAKGYRIYGVESYGVVLQTPNGFTIARVGKQLKIGEITSITAHRVTVGPYVINQ